MVSKENLLGFTQELDKLLNENKTVKWQDIKTFKMGLDSLRGFQVNTNSDGQLLVNCILKYIDVISLCNYCDTHSARKQLSHVVKSFKPILDIFCTQPLSNVFVQYATEPIFSSVMYETFTALCKRELLRTYCLIATKSDKKIRKAIASSLEYYMYQLADLLSTSADYDTQLHVIEVIFRIYGTYLKEHKYDIIPTSAELSRAFLDISVQSFDESVRLYLNKYNSNSQRIFSVACNFVLFGKTRCRFPAGMDKMWVDFNLTVANITWYTDISPLVNPPTEDVDSKWNMITLLVSDVTSVRVERRDTMLVIDVEFKEPCLCTFADAQMQLKSAEHNLKFVIKDESKAVINKLTSYVLPGMFKNQFEHSSSKICLPRKNVYKPLKLSVTRKFSESLNSSSTTGIKSRTKSDSGSSLVYNKKSKRTSNIEITDCLSLTVSTVKSKNASRADVVSISSDSNASQLLACGQTSSSEKYDTACMDSVVLIESKKEKVTSPYFNSEMLPDEDIVKTNENIKVSTIKQSSEFQTAEFDSSKLISPDLFQPVVQDDIVTSTIGFNELSRDASIDDDDVQRVEILSGRCSGRSSAFNQAVVVKESQSPVIPHVSHLKKDILKKSNRKEEQEVQSVRKKKKKKKNRLDAFCIGNTESHQSIGPAREPDVQVVVIDDEEMLNSSFNENQTSNVPETGKKPSEHEVLRCERNTSSTDHNDPVLLDDKSNNEDDELAVIPLDVANDHEIAETLKQVQMDVPCEENEATVLKLSQIRDSPIIYAPLLFESSCEVLKNEDLVNRDVLIEDRPQLLEKTNSEKEKRGRSCEEVLSRQEIGNHRKVIGEKRKIVSGSSDDDLPLICVHNKKRKPKTYYNKNKTVVDHSVEEKDREDGAEGTREEIEQVQLKTMYVNIERMDFDRNNIEENPERVQQTKFTESQDIMLTYEQIAGSNPHEKVHREETNIVDEPHSTEIIIQPDINEIEDQNKAVHVAQTELDVFNNTETVQTLYPTVIVSNNINNVLSSPETLFTKKINKKDINPEEINNEIHAKVTDLDAIEDCGRSKKKNREPLKDLQIQNLLQDTVEVSDTRRYKKTYCNKKKTKINHSGEKYKEDEVGSTRDEIKQAKLKTQFVDMNLDVISISEPVKQSNFGGSKEMIIPNEQIVGSNSEKKLQSEETNINTIVDEPHSTEIPQNKAAAVAETDSVVLNNTEPIQTLYPTVIVSNNVNNVLSSPETPSMKKRNKRGLNPDDINRDLDAIEVCGQSKNKLTKKRNRAPLKDIQIQNVLRNNTKTVEVADTTRNENVFDNTTLAGKRRKRLYDPESFVYDESAMKRMEEEISRKFTKETEVGKKTKNVKGEKSRKRERKDSTKQNKSTKKRIKPCKEGFSFMKSYYNNDSDAEKSVTSPMNKNFTLNGLIEELDYELNRKRGINTSFRFEARNTRKSSNKRKVNKKSLTMLDLRRDETEEIEDNPKFKINTSPEASPLPELEIEEYKSNPVTPESEGFCGKMLGKKNGNESNKINIISNICVAPPMTDYDVFDDTQIKKKGFHPLKPIVEVEIPEIQEKEDNETHVENQPHIEGEKIENDTIRVVLKCFGQTMNGLLGQVLKQDCAGSEEVVALKEVCKVLKQIK